MQVLVIDVGGNHVKILVTGQKDSREFASGPSMTAEEMADFSSQVRGGEWKDPLNATLTAESATRQGHRSFLT